MNGPDRHQTSTGTLKPSPDEALAMLKKGNERFFSGRPEYPHSDSDRVLLAGRADQGDYAYATVISCSDSRVPVELIFDAGIMDIFVVRLAGNVCTGDGVGSIEYGLCHVHTPLLVVLGHTQCGAVTAVLQSLQGGGRILERNIPPLIRPLTPAVERALAAHPEIRGDALVSRAVEENVWQGIKDLFMMSPSIRTLVKGGKVRVMGAIYDVGSGRVNWLSSSRVDEILAGVESCPERATDPTGTR